MAQTSTEHDQLATWDEEHLLHPWSFDGPSLMIVKGEGSLYWDADGREYIDGLGSIQLCEVGHGRTELAEVAAAQMAQLEFAPLFWNFVNEPAARLAHRLAELAPEKLTHTFFTNDGSESCETAIKTVRNYHHIRDEGSRQTILSLRRAYHGMTYGALAASGLEGMKKGFGDLPPNFVQLSTPYPFRAEFPDQGAGPVDYCLRELEEVIERVGPKNIAAFIGEPVLTVGGVIVPPEEYWPKVAEMCREHGILMIADEVVTAFGRLGKWFASATYEPDVIAFAKGVTSGYVPLGGVLVSEEIAHTVRSAESGFLHGFTYSGHPVACAVGLRNIDIIERERLPENAVEVGSYLLNRLKSLENLPVVGEVRGAGLLVGIELVRDKTTRAPLELRRQEIANRIRDEEGVIVRSILQNIIIAPCLTLTHSEADRIADGIERVLATIEP